MHSSIQYLNDEHMQLYKWSGAGTGSGCAIPQRSKRTHAWHASYAVLAVMTTFLLLNGHDKKWPAEQTGVQVGQAVQDMKEKVAPLNENGRTENNITEGNTTHTDPAQEAGRTLDEAREKAGKNIEQVGKELQK